MVYWLWNLEKRSMTQSLKILNIVEARPNLPKIAPIMHEMQRHPEIEAILVHIGQHYDEKLSDICFPPDGYPLAVNLEVGSGSFASQSAEILKRIVLVLIERKPALSKAKLASPIPAASRKRPALSASPASPRARTPSAPSLSPKAQTCWLVPIRSKSLPLPVIPWRACAKQGAFLLSGMAMLPSA
jgi:hypothetical protein